MAAILATADFRLLRTAAGGIITSTRPTTRNSTRPLRFRMRVVEVPSLRSAPAAASRAG
jgi:hypothetical protein